MALRENNTLPCELNARQRPKIARQRHCRPPTHGKDQTATSTTAKNLCRAFWQLCTAKTLCHARVLCRASIACAVSHFLAVRWTTFAVSPPLPCAFSSLPGVLYLDARHRGFAKFKKMVTVLTSSTVLDRREKGREQRP
jgi:hypothetical protein